MNKLLKSEPLVIYTKFLKIRIRVISLLLDDIGSFERFCIKAISNDLSLEEISNITNLRPDVIEERINFLIGHKYIIKLDDVYEFTNKGRKIIEHLEIVESINREPIFFAIDKSGKNIFDFNQLKKFFILKGKDTSPLIQEKISNYKIEFENELRYEIENKAWNLILLGNENIDRTELNIVYDCLENYFLPIELNFDDILYLKSSKNDKENIYVPCIEKKIKFSFQELENLDHEEKKALENLEEENLSILEKLVNRYLVEKKEEQFILTESGNLISDLIKWDREYSQKPILIYSDSIWGSDISGKNLISKIYDLKKILNSPIKTDIENQNSNKNLLLNIIADKEIKLPLTLIEPEYSLHYETKYLPISLTNKWIKNKIYKSANISCEICNNIKKIQCKDCIGKKEIQPYKKCSCSEGWNKCSCNNGIKDCLHCSTTGKIILCNSCKGTNTCFSCSGIKKEKLKCNNCSGTGTVYFFFTCSICNGLGNYLPPNCRSCNGNLTCSFCKGNSYKVCGNCNGVGRVSCFTCRETGKLKCRLCDGVGYFPQIICQYCDEEGLVSCTECILY